MFALRPLTAVLCCVALAGCTAADARSAVDATKRVVVDASTTAAAELLRAGVEQELVDGRLPTAALESFSTSYDFAVSLAWTDADADGFADGSSVTATVLGAQFCMRFDPQPVQAVPGPCTG
jgi:hypothetical protein